jgi:hypothetical protein
VLNSFAFNYHVPPTIDHKLSEKLRNGNNQPPTKSKKKKKFKHSQFLSVNSTTKNERFNFHRFIICCNPRKTTATID